MSSQKNSGTSGSSYRQISADDDAAVGVSMPRSQNMATMSRLVEMARPERHLMIFSVITMAFGSAVSLAVPSYSGKIIDLSIGAQQQISANDSNSLPFRLFLSLMRLLSIMILASISGFFRQWWQAQAGHRIVARLRRKLYAAILSQDAAYFDSINQGDLISRLSSDADLVQSAVTNEALALLRNIVVSIGAVSFLFYISVSLALVAVVVLPPLAVCARFVGRRMKERQKRVRELHAEATSLAEQALTCIRTVQQFVAEPYEAQQYNRAINQAHAEGIENTKLGAFFGNAMGLVVNLALLCVLGFGGVQVQKGELTAGDLASFVMYSVMMGGSISSISALYIDLMKAVATGQRIFEIIDREPHIPPPHIVEPAENELLIAGTDSDATTEQKSTVEMVSKELDETERDDLSNEIVPKSVQFDEVTFSYPTRPESKILKGLNLSIQAGQMIALVGNSGSGKSTIASLLTRLYDPQSGVIRIDGMIVKDMVPQDVRRNVGIVAQEPLLFPTTIEANIRYGSPNATEEQVREAARLAFVLEFSDKFPDGLSTVVGTRGTQLSCGQKQRVVVARCLLKNPPVVVFDEATSALDAESESQVQKAIDTACKGRTVILIAHRLSTIRNVDSVVVLEEGRVAEMGSFDELRRQQDSAFRQLMEKQLLVK